MSNLSGVKAAEIYCFMRDMGNDHQPSWEAAYAVIRSQQGGMFEISPDHAAILITAAVVTDPGSFPPNSVQYLDDLFGGSIGASESLNDVLHSTDSSDSNSFNSTNSTDDEKLISTIGNVVTFDNQGIYDVINPDKPDQNSVVDQIETTIDQLKTPDYIVVPDFNNPVPEMPSPEFKSFDSLTNPAPRFGDKNWERMDELLMERDTMLEIAKMLEERMLLERRLSLANGQVNEQPTSDNTINSNAFANKPDVEFADDPLTNFQANANESSKSGHAVRRFPSYYYPQITSGTEGDDIMTAEGGYDMFFGKGGNDVIIGGLRDDYIRGGKGNDQITGGGGKDTFIIESGSGFDMIMDFVDGEDQLVFFDGNGSGITELEITNVGNTAMIYNDDELLAVVNGAAAGMLEAQSYQHILA